MRTLYCPQFSVKFWLTRGKTILETWGKDVDIIPNTNIQGYYGSTENYISFLKELYLHQGAYDWYVIDCDDVYIWTKRLESGLEKISAEPSCFCCIYDFAEDFPQNKWSQCRGAGSESPVRFPSGSCFALNNSAFKKIVEYLINNSDPAYSYYADVAFGMWIRICGIKMIHDGRFDIEGKNIDEEHLKTNLMSHRLSCEKIREFYKRFGGNDEDALLPTI
jgi:hypothetical protein